MQLEMETEEPLPDDEVPPTIESEDEEQSTDGQSIDIGSEFHDDIFSGGQDRTRQTRSQKHAERQRHAREQSPEQTHPLEMTPEKFQRLQDEDPTLLAICLAASGVSVMSAGPGFFRKKGRIYRSWVLSGRSPDMSVEQLVVPKECRLKILEIAHSVPLSGHLGRDKTVHRILQRFYWPTLYRDAGDYCRRCQKARGHEVH